MLIIDLYGSMIKLVKTVLANYLPTTLIKNHTGDLREITPVHDLRESQLSDADLFIGVEARVLLTALEDDTSQAEISKFLRYFITNRD